MSKKQRAVVSNEVNTHVLVTGGISLSHASTGMPFAFAMLKTKFDDSV